MLAVGQVVFSKSGRDKGLPFVITSIEQNPVKVKGITSDDSVYVYLSDGSYRKLKRPKKKKLKHVQLTNTVLTEIQSKLKDGGDNLLDADIRKALLDFNS